jgi:hypothetical protein
MPEEQRREKPLTLILAEAPLETIPRELWSHPSVYRYARKRGKPPRSLLLDAAMHHQAMKKLPGRERRGRPDIVHTLLLAVLDSPLCRHTACRIIIHTVGDMIIHVRPRHEAPEELPPLHRAHRTALHRGQSAARQPGATPPARATAHPPGPGPRRPPAPHTSLRRQRDRAHSRSKPGMEQAQPPNPGDA